ncbi:bifunctional glycosyltransferase/CDP-glycerol:glycerophosphate glycerophosphotransferase [Listeria costaricensis]|uniref:bifunctional glycosyltransferase/CDP-glycerol:glycerophosphate glycerophosphotransferase n=1 Tax=Listeria costaricensis TaxID=2026604 RepID=UPI000C06B33D|nr:CDP-glycerol glycerophosphotransferase family protein [Listeria costaricensis]
MIKNKRYLHKKISAQKEKNESKQVVPMTPIRQKENKFKLSIIMAVYNVEDYIEEAIDSLLNQSVNFIYNVQLILVNDGSEDSSGKIADEYARKYPANIMSIDKKNGGVSSARNKGLEFAQGEYVNFMDPDDKLKEDALERLFLFIRKNPDINVIAFPLFFFEAKTGGHMLNYKFDRERIVDIEKQHKDIIMSLGATIIKREKFENRELLEGKKYGEDNQILTEIVMEDKKYGIVPEAKYLYRRRYKNNSALQESTDDVDYFITYLEEEMVYKINKYKDSNGRLPLYIQYIIMYDLQWRLKYQEKPAILKKNGLSDKYQLQVYQIMQFIDDKIILEQKHLNWYQKHALVKFKYTGCFPDYRNTYYLTKAKKNDLALINFTGDELYLLSKITADIDIIEYDKGSKTFHIMGSIGTLFPYETMEIYLKNEKNKKIVATRISYPNDDAYILGDCIHEFYGFEFFVNESFLRDSTRIKMFIKCENQARRLSLKFRGQSTKFSNQFDGLYIATASRFISYSKKTREFYVKPKTLLAVIKNERILCKELQKLMPKREAKKIISRRLKLRYKKGITKSKVNIFLDRIDKADDSAEVLYRYFEEQKAGKNYFILTQDAADIDRLKQENFRIVHYKSAEHFELLYTADNLISSHADRFIYNPFGDINDYYKDLKEFNYVFLQHGIITSDLSGWLKKSDKNFSTFVTASKYEQQSILKGNYQYSENEVVLTGLPRYDRLQTVSGREKNILIMPTWRKNIVKGFDAKTNSIPYAEDFKNSEYYKVWDHLLSSQKVKDILSENGYKLVFVPHPSIRQQLCDFHVEPENVAGYKERYVDLFNSAALLITDYSSVAFDFAYMKKPILYYQFDQGNWGNSEGYFDYVHHGFGDVVTLEEELIQKVEQILLSDVKMELFYQERVENFFAYVDTNNSKRLLDNIIEKG